MKRIISCIAAILATSLLGCRSSKIVSRPSPAEYPLVFDEIISHFHNSSYRSDLFLKRMVLNNNPERTFEIVDQHRIVLGLWQTKGDSLMIFPTHEITTEKGFQEVESIGIYNMDDVNDFQTFTIDHDTLYNNSSYIRLRHAMWLAYPPSDEEKRTWYKVNKDSSELVTWIFLGAVYFHNSYQLRESCH